jgi:hypothetical protein
MRQYLDENSKINEIRLQLRHPTNRKNLWILVEGETDQKLYAKLISGGNTKVETVHGGGVENLRRAISKLIEETNRVIGIRDADFLHLDKQLETVPCLFLTDAHDAEIMMLSCDAVFESLVAEFVESRRIDFDILRRQILESIAFLGVIRWLNNAESLELNFKGLGLATFFDSSRLCVDKDCCVHEIENRSPSQKRAIQRTEIDNKLAEISDYYNLCNGHDFEKAFALHITAKNPGKKGVKDEDVGKFLRIAYRKQDFESTKLYALLKQWEGRTGYALF